MVRLDRAMVKAEERTIDLAFSSELPVVQYWGIEVLDHSPGAMRMDRAKGGIAMLFNHDRDLQLGILEDCRCDDDKKGRGTGRFSRSSAAEEKFRDVQDGILKDVSVGYQVHHMQEMDVKKLPPDLMEMAAREKLPVYKITDWEPFECSLVRCLRTRRSVRTIQGPEAERRRRGKTHRRNIMRNSNDFLALTISSGEKESWKKSRKLQEIERMPCSVRRQLRRPARQARSSERASTSSVEGSRTSCRSHPEAVGKDALTVSGHGLSGETGADRHAAQNRLVENPHTRHTRVHAVEAARCAAELLATGRAS
jgi:hypothetical protein